MAVVVLDVRPGAAHEFQAEIHRHAEGLLQEGVDVPLGHKGLTTGLVLPPGHRKAVVENLALAIAARNPKTARPGPTLRSDAEDSIKVIEALNYRPTSRTTDLPLHARRSNIYGGREGR